MLVHTPLALPKLEPDDWDKWWHIWNLYAQPIVRVKNTHNKWAAEHTGFEVWNPNVRSTYTAAYVDLKRLYPSLYEQLTCLPFDIYSIKFGRADNHFRPHTDHPESHWEVRNLFHCADPLPQWFYTTKEDRRIVPLSLAPDTNWWAYRDGVINHGSMFKPQLRKTLVIVIPRVQKDADEFVERHGVVYPKQSLWLRNGSLLKE